MFLHRKRWVFLKFQSEPYSYSYEVFVENSTSPKRMFQILQITLPLGDTLQRTNLPKLGLLCKGKQTASNRPPTPQGCSLLLVSRAWHVDLAHSGCSTCGCWMKDHNSNGMQSSILFFLALEPLPFFRPPRLVPSI